MSRKNPNQNREMSMSHYARSISEITDLNPVHCETVFIEAFRTLDALTKDEFKAFVQQIERVEAANPGWLIGFHKSVVVEA